MIRLLKYKRNSIIDSDRIRLINPCYCFSKRQQLISISCQVSLCNPSQNRLKRVDFMGNTQLLFSVSLPLYVFLCVYLCLCFCLSHRKYEIEIPRDTKRIIRFILPKDNREDKAIFPSKKSEEMHLWWLQNEISFSTINRFGKKNKRVKSRYPNSLLIVRCC